MFCQAQVDQPLDRRAVVAMQADIRGDIAAISPWPVYFHNDGTAACAAELVALALNDVQPHKSAGFNTGVPAPVGAGLAFAPVYLWLITGETMFRSWMVVMPWILFIAALMISSVPTFTWTSMRIRREWRLFALAGVALLGAALVTTPWITLLGVSLLYLAAMPLSIASYGRVKRRRAIPVAPSSGGAPIRPAADNAR